VVKLASTISKHLKTVSETFLSCDQSTWLFKGLQQIHAAGHEAHRRAVNQSSSSLASLHPDTPRPAARGARQPPFTAVRDELPESSPGGLRPAGPFLCFN
jgi:hypothetical protein